MRRANSRLAAVSKGAVHDPGRSSPCPSREEAIYSEPRPLIRFTFGQQMLDLGATWMSQPGYGAAR